MSDPVEMAVAGGSGIGLGAIIVGLLKWSGSRNITTLDSTIQSLNTSVIGLSKDIQSMREKNIGQEKDVAQLSEKLGNFDQRLEGLAKYWREQFEIARMQTHQRLEDASMKLMAATEACTALSNAMIAMKGGSRKR